MRSSASGRLASEGKLKFICPKCHRRVTTRLRVAGTRASCPACDARVRVPPLVTFDLVEAARWYCYDGETEARVALRSMRQGPLGGPGWIELRHDPQSVRPWWVVLYNLLSGTATDMARVYQIPPARETRSWTPYEHPDRLPCRMAHTEIVELTEVRASRTNLIKAADALADAYYTGSPDVTCREEAQTRLRTILFGASQSSQS